MINVRTRYLIIIKIIIMLLKISENNNVEMKLILFLISIKNIVIIIKFPIFLDLVYSEENDVVKKN
jgi:hypothetical protein